MRSPSIASKRHGRTRPKLHGRILWTVLVLPLAAGRASGDDERSAAAVLESKGLTPAGFVWITPRERQLRKRLETFDALHRRYQLALQRNNEALKEAQRWEAQKKAAPNPSATPPANPQTGSANPASNQPPGNGAKATSPPPENSAAEPAAWQAAHIELCNAQTALELAVLSIPREAAALEGDYRPLRANREVREACGRLGPKCRLGPAKDYERDVQRIAAVGEKVLASTVPIYRESGRYRATLVFNEQIPATLSLAENDQAVLITANLAIALGLPIGEDLPRQDVRIGNRTLAGRKTKVASLRIGEAVFSDVAVLVLPPEAEDWGSQLGSAALSGCQLQWDPRAMSLTANARANERKGN